MQLPNVEAMSSAEKRWFACSIAGMVVADGRTDKSEMEFLKEAINFLDDKDEVNNIMKVIKEGKIPEMGSLEIDPKQSFLMLKYLAQLMVADSDLATKEISFFLLSGKLLGFSNDIQTKFWKSARALLEKDLPQGIIETSKERGCWKDTELKDIGITYHNICEIVKQLDNPPKIKELLDEPNDLEKLPDELKESEELPDSIELKLNN